MNRWLLTGTPELAPNGGSVGGSGRSSSGVRFAPRDRLEILVSGQAAYKRRKLDSGHLERGAPVLRYDDITNVIAVERSRLPPANRNAAEWFGSLSA